MGLYNQLITIGTTQTIDLVGLGLFPTGTGFLLSTQSDGTALPAGVTITSDGKLTIATGATNGSFPLRITDGSTTIIYTVSLVAAAASILNGDSGNNTLGNSVGTGIQQIFGFEGIDSLIGGTVDDQLNGGEGNDSLTGNAGNDILDGDAGNDTLIGGAGNDTYFVDSSTDVITETAGNGTDVVHSTTSYTLGTEVENLFLLGVGSINGTGNILANRIVGNTGNNILSSGTDALVDTLIGGLGDDTYIIGSGDLAQESTSVNEGTDTVQSSDTYNLGATFLENLTLLGTANINATGNIGNNIITGNGGNNAINGGTGADQLIGLGGNDTYTVDNALDVVTEASSAGTDLVNSSVTYTLAVNVENLTLSGTAVINGTGNDLANTINGNTVANTLNGGIGADTLSGGGGNDIYIVDNTGDVVNGGAGTDTVQSSVTYTIATFANVENITLTGASAINATGNTSVNTLTGNSAANTLDGGTGADTLVGLGGNDIYRVDNTGDVVTEVAGAGIDTVQSAITYTLVAEVENLTLLTGAVDGTGNTLANIITGNDANNTLNSGTDNLVDTLIGGAGNDTYIVGGTTDIVTEALNAGTDTIQSAVTYTLAALTNVENLTLTGTTAINGSGNALANVITGNSADNILNSGTDTTLADTLVGLGGNDTYVVGSTNDVVTEVGSGGTDLVQSTVTYTLASEVENLTLTGTTAINGTGNALANTITGNGGNNILSGGTEGTAAIDSLVGGAGDDTYLWSTEDTISDSAGNDTVSSSVTVSLASFTGIENITLTGTTAATATGNTGNNVINGASNTVADTLIGGAGNDTYIVGSTDIITEDPNAGTDTIQSLLTYSLATLANVENLNLSATGSTAINGTGNASANTITGNALANTLDGGAGADILIGGNLGDTYTVDNIGDVVTELLADTGTDLVNSSVTYTLSANIETLTLSGSTNINGTGNALANTINGNSGNNILSGGTEVTAAIDSLAGGTGDDTYLWSTEDTINDSAGNDTVSSGVAIDLTLTAFANIENVTLTGAATINATGNTGDNVLNGASNTAANLLTGGAGNDTYILGALDTISDSAGTADTVSSAVTVSLASFPSIENITLTGTASINATGNSSVNTIVGNSGFNILDGGAGNDIITSGTGSNVIIGGGGADALTGGTGANVFSYGTTRTGYTANLADSLLGTMDTITGFTATDKFQAVVNPTTTVFTGGSVTTGTLTEAGIQAVLTPAAFTSYRAATFTFGSNTYVAINDSVAGFSSTTDAVINIGATTAATITSANFVLPWA